MNLEKLREEIDNKKLRTLIEIDGTKQKKKIGS